MNKIVLFLAIGLLCSCRHYYRPGEVRFTVIPTPPHHNTVEVYFPGEKLPERDEYIKVGTLAATTSGYDNSTSMIASLTAQAQQKGYDAVIILGQNTSQELVSSETLLESINEILTGKEEPDEYSLKNYKTLTALGIKFKKNINYLNEYIKNEQVYFIDDGNEELIAMLNYNLNKRIVKTDTISNYNFNKYTRYLKEYDTGFWLDDKGPEWLYYKNEQSLERERFYCMDGLTTKKCSIIYNYRNQVQTITIKKINVNRRMKFAFKMDFIYSDDNFLVSKKITTANNEIFLEEINYTDGKYSGRTIYQVKDADKIPVLRTQVGYYAFEDIPALVSSK